MDNKLGLYYCRLENVEKKIINLKLNLLDESFSFNCDLFSIEYLVRLNKFLFEDIYNFNNDSIICINKMECEYLELLLKELKIVVNNEDINKIVSLVEQIWHYQPFIVGNTRTMIAYLKVLKESFLLDIPLDVNDNIESNPKIFNKMKVLTIKG